LLNEIQPDSQFYIDASPFRPILYHLILNICKFTGIDIFLFQELTLSLSLLSLIVSLEQNKKKRIFIFFFISLILSNIYYLSFAKTILTEAIFFSLINFSLSVFLLLKSHKNLFLLGFLIGLIAVIKPVGIIFTIIFLFFIFMIVEKNKKNFIILLSATLTPFLIETIMFYSNFTKRESLFPVTVTGKIYFLSGKESFDVSKYPGQYENLLKNTKKEFASVQEYLKNIKNLILRAELSSDYEVVSQYQTYNLKSVKNFDNLKEELNKNYNQLLFFMIKNNFFDYIQLCLTNYLGNWSFGFKFIYWDKIKNEAPLIEELKKSSGPMDIPNKKILLIAQIYFITILLFTSSFFLFLLRNIFRKNNNLNDWFFLCFTQIYLISVSVTNIGNIRYLMPIYPILLLICIRIFEILVMSRKSKQLK
tara:strand:- start:727 stop:1986 length:1260 start_codon:yes stop_codon:yes gene_type:complete